MSNETPGIDFGVDAGLGLENLTSKDLAIPYLTIVQKMSPVMDDLEKGAKLGQILNPITGKLYDSIDVISCAYVRTVNEWISRDNGGGLVAVHNPDSPEYHNLQGESTKGDARGILLTPQGNELVETGSHFVLFRESGTSEEWQEAIISFTSSQAKKSKAINTSITQQTVEGSNGRITPARFANWFTLTTTVENKDKFTWHGWSVEHMGLLKDPKTYALAKNYNIVSEKTTDQMLLSYGQVNDQLTTGSNAEVVNADSII